MVIRVPTFLKGTNIFSQQESPVDQAQHPTWTSLNSPPHRKLTLQSLPLEIRRKIYSHLLLASNVISTASSPGLILSFATSLFRVCKQISAESLQYFHHENTFISLLTNLSHLWNVFEDVIPMAVIPSLEHRLIRVPEVSCALTYTDTTCPSYLGPLRIFEVESLPNVIRIINTEHILSKAQIGDIELVLRFPQFCATPMQVRTTSLVAAALTGIRQTPKATRRLRLVLQGYVSEAGRKLIEDGFAKPHPSHAEIMDMALQSRDRGLALIGRGSYAAARGEYALCFFMIERMRKRARLHWAPDLSLSLRSLWVDAYLDMSLIETAEAYHEEAIGCAEKAWELVSDGEGPLDNVPELKFGLGLALAAAGRHEDAVGAITHALSLDPENEVMRAMLEGLTAHLGKLKQMNVPAEKFESFREWFKVKMVDNRRALQALPAPYEKWEASSWD